MTSDAAPTERVTVETDILRELIIPVRFVLWDLDGPICRLFAGHPAHQVAGQLVRLVEGSGDDDTVHQRWLQMRDAQARVLQHNLQAIRSTHGIDVQVTFRALPFTPPVKLYLFNGEEALIGYYIPTKREEEWQSQTLEMYDALGSQSLLFSFLKRTGHRDAAFVEESQKWFDALWETITTDLTLS